MLPRKNIDEPNVNNSPRGYPKGSPKGSPKGYPKATLSYPLGTLMHAYASMLAYTYIRKLGTAGVYEQQ